MTHCLRTIYYKHYVMCFSSQTHICQTTLFTTRPHVHTTFLRGSGSRSAETSKWLTWSKPKKWY